MTTISVVICAYNEAGNVGPVIEGTLSVLSQVTSDYEVIVVDDGSTDDTRTVISHIAQGNPAVKMISHAVNQGMGQALLDGYQAAQKELVTFLPADGQISPSDIKLFADNIEGYELVVSYYIKRPASMFRQMTSKGVRAILFLLFGRMPRYEGTYMFRRDILKDIPLKMNTSFVLNYELIIRAQRQGYRIKEVGTTCLERVSGSSKVLGLKKIFFILSQIIELRFKHF
jgi:glycosyltransferase involved in cell wall biosynthesis